VTSQLAWMLGIPGAVFLLALTFPAVRRAYRLAAHCLVRHPIVWRLPAGFAFIYAAFDVVTLIIIRWRGGRAWPPLLDWQPLAEGDVMATLGVLPALEQLAGIWNCLVSVFPLSVVAALLLLVNYRRLTGELISTLRRRFGGKAWLLILGLLVCALAELVKPLLMVALPELSARFPWQSLLLAATCLNALAFIFEYLFGTALQLCLLLTVYGWARGLQFDDRRMLPFAVRRLGFVIKWSLVIIAATLLLLHIPFALDAWWTGGIRWPTESFRLALAVAMLVCGAVQIQLALHNDSLRQAFTANFQFLRAHGFSYLALVLAALALFFGLQILRLAGEQMLGDSLLTAAWTMLLHVVCAAVGGWVLAAWVCLFHARSGGREISF